MGLEVILSPMAPLTVLASPGVSGLKTIVGFMLLVVPLVALLMFALV